MSFETIGDFVDLQRGNTYKSALLGQVGPYLLGLGSIARDGGFRGDKLKTYGGHSDERMLVTSGDLYVSLKDVTQSGDLLGAIARVPSEIKIGRMTQDTVKLIFKKEVSKDYFYWLLRTPQYRKYCRSRATGTTNLGLSREDFFNFPVPALDSKKKSLVTILEACESKITLNTQINQTLEQMAQALFKSWFIDFDPVIDNALEAGNPIPEPLTEHAARRQAIWTDNETAPVRLPLETRRLFPDRFEEDGVLGWVPAGWKAKPVGDVIEIVGGGTPKTGNHEFWKDGHHAFCTPKDMSNLDCKLLLQTERHLTNAGVQKISSGQLPTGTVLMSSRAPIGYLAIGKIPISVNQGIIALKPNDVFDSEFLLFWLDANREQVKSRANGSTFLEISKKNFRNIPFLMPSDNVCTEFGRIAKSYMDVSTSFKKQVVSLTQLRDTLLPKLLSGELQLPEAEAAVDTALETATV